MAHHIRRIVTLAVAIPLLSATLACSGGGDSTAAKSSANTEKSTARKGGAKPAPGDATITIGEETWKFDNVACGFGEEGTGVPGAVVNASATKDRISLYVADDGDDIRYIELADLDDPDEGMNWSTDGSEDGVVPDIVIDGKKITSEATFHSVPDIANPIRTGKVVVNCG